ERTMEEGKPTISTDAREDLSLKSIASVEDLGLRSVLCVPLHGRRQMSGALYLDNPFERAVFETEDLEITESFCAQALLALRSAERRRQVAELLRQVRAANRKLDGELRLSRREAERGARASGTSFAGMVGDSAALRKVFQLIDAVGPTDIPVLITGESGTGKELAARAIYRQSLRAQRPFVAENCAAVPAALLESALFGHVRGAFTGADSDRAGLFELADGGTLFLDEVAEMPVELQTRLLRVLQEKEVRPVGSKKTVRVDVRIIAATNRDPRKAIEEGRLREDLFYRLEGAIIRLPALRERPGDIPLLVEHFLRESAGGKLAKRVSPEALERLASYSWPGNVRELQNEVRRIALLSPGEVVRMDALSPQIREEASRPKKENESARIRPLAEVEREAILEALAATGGHRGKAAAALGVSRSTLYLKLRSITGAGA
ncbi:MAG TPA: sigma-54-dependent Fis family transcriptional regulator, partial [Planctomycetota bacterium]|nr:sigma-54-dependent Fis family transcriptional regulator [Planctomycetota bacterium]